MYSCMTWNWMLNAVQMRLSYVLVVAVSIRTPALRRRHAAFPLALQRLRGLIPGSYNDCMLPLFARLHVHTLYEI